MSKTNEIKNGNLLISLNPSTDTIKLYYDNLTVMNKADLVAKLKLSFKSNKNTMNISNIFFYFNTELDNDITVYKQNINIKDTFECAFTENHTANMAIKKLIQHINTQVSCVIAIDPTVYSALVVVTGLYQTDIYPVKTKFTYKLFLL
jgi:hypothetical protein